jgi:hypothetical protein
VKVKPRDVALVSDAIPKTCTIADICRHMNISRAQFHALRKEGTFPIPELLPKLDLRPRFSGEAVQQYLNNQLQRSA